MARSQNRNYGALKCKLVFYLECIIWTWMYYFVHSKNIWFFKGSLHAVMVIFRTIAFWRTLLCRNGSLLEFRVLCSRSFVFQICTCQSTSLVIVWSSVIQLHRLSTLSQWVNYFILKFKYKFNLKIVTGFKTNMVLSFFLFFWSHIAWVCAALLSFGNFASLLH